MQHPLPQVPAALVKAGVLHARGLRLPGSRRTRLPSTACKNLTLKICILFLELPRDHRYSTFLKQYTVDCLSRYPLYRALCFGGRRKEEGKRIRSLFSVNNKEIFPKLHVFQVSATTPKCALLATILKSTNYKDLLRTLESMLIPYNTRL